MGWISVEDKLPEPYQEVLVFQKAGFWGRKAIALPLAQCGIYVCQYWENKFCIAFDIYGLDHVTHWMPLPEEPKDD